MSKILRRPMFRGGAVDSRGTGITSGLMDGGRVGYKTGGDILKNVNARFDPFYQNMNMDQLRAFQSLGMGNPFRSERDMLGRFKNAFTFQDPARNSIVDKIVSSAPIVQEQEKFEEDVDKNRQILDNKEFFSGDVDEVIKQSTPVNMEKGEDANMFSNNQEETTEIDPKTLMRENAELFKELLGEGNKKKLRDARISDASDYLLQFFKGSQKEGATVGSAAADVAAFASERPSKTEQAKATIDKQDQTAVALAINDYVAGKRSKEQLDALIAKSDLALSNKKAAIDYANKLTQGFSALPGFIADSKAIGYANRVVDGLRKSGLSQFPLEKVTSKEMEEQFKFNPETDTGKIFIETDTKTTYTLVSDEAGGYKKNIIDQG